MKTVTLYLSMDEAKNLFDELEFWTAKNGTLDSIAELAENLGYRIEAANEV